MTKKALNSTGHFQSFFVPPPPPDPKSDKNPVNQLIKKFWPYQAINQRNALKEYILPMFWIYELDLGL